MLDAMPRVSTQILTNTYDRPWTPDGFKSLWASACKAAGISGVTFHDLRGTAVVRFAEASCTEPEIAAITGHSLANVKTLLEAYWTPTKAQAASAIRKLEGTKSGTKL